MTDSRIRRIPAVLLLVLGVSFCDSPTRPDPNDDPPPPPPPVWVVSGQIVANPGNQPISGAGIRIDDSESLRTDASGNFEVRGEGTQSQNRKLNISADGFLDRETYLRDGATRDVAIDLINLLPPFSLDFYRQMARGSLDFLYHGQEGLLPLLRWPEPPRYYIKTTDEAGGAYPQADIDLVAYVIRRSIPQLNGNRFNVAEIVTGPEDRPAEARWTIVRIKRDLDACGVGSGSSISLRYGRGCSCNPSFNISPYITAHEVGHAMGFWHHNSHGVMGNRRDCSNPETQDIEFSEQEKFHAGVAYSRPKGNRDPDIDPSDFRFVVPDADSTRMIKCYSPR